MGPAMTDNRKVTSQQDSIKEAVREIETYVSSFGWDAPIRVFALVKAADALSDHPELAGELPADVPLSATANPHALFSVEQEGLPPADSVEALLAQIAWPDDVAGAAVTCERITLPPEAEEEMPEDPGALQEFLASDPRRDDVRMVVGVLRTGEAWCALRIRSHDNDAEVLYSADLIPELVTQLRATFE